MCGMLKSFHRQSGGVYRPPAFKSLSSFALSGVLAYSIQSGGLVGSSAAKFPFPNGSTIDVTAKVIPPKPLIGAALLNFAKKVVWPLQVAFAVRDLAKELGFNLSKNPDGSLLIQKPDPTVCTVAPCYAYTFDYKLGTFPSVESAAAAYVNAYGTTIFPGEYFVYGGGGTGGTPATFPIYNSSTGTYSRSFYQAPAVQQVAPSASGSMVTATESDFSNAVANKTDYAANSALPQAVVDALNSGESIGSATPTVSGPTSAPGPSSTINSGNTTTTNNTTYNVTYNGNQISYTTTNSSTVNNGTTSTTTTSTSKDDQTDPCSTNPDRVGCSQLGAPPAAEDLPKQSIPVTFSATVFAAPAGCPPPYSGSIKVLGFVKEWSFKFDPMCDLMNTLRPLFLAVGAAATAWLMMEFLKS